MSIGTSWFFRISIPEARIYYTAAREPPWRNSPPWVEIKDDSYLIVIGTLCIITELFRIPRLDRKSNYFALISILLVRSWQALRASYPAIDTRI